MPQVHLELQTNSKWKAKEQGMLRSLYDASTILSHKDKGNGGFSELNLAVPGEPIMGTQCGTDPLCRLEIKISLRRA
jgi:hypothetical protein